jgi:hypothetical protein
VVVECTAGARYPDRPLAFVWEGERLVVSAVEREWRTPDGLVFRVDTAGGRQFTLTYDEARDAWHVQAAERRVEAGTCEGPCGALNPWHRARQACDCGGVEMTTAPPADTDPETGRA